MFVCEFSGFIIGLFCFACSCYFYLHLLSTRDVPNPTTVWSLAFYRSCVGTTRWGCPSQEEGEDRAIYQASLRWDKSWKMCADKRNSEPSAPMCQDRLNLSLAEVTKQRRARADDCGNVLQEFGREITLWTVGTLNRDSWFWCGFVLTDISGTQK